LVASSRKFIKTNQQVKGHFDEESEDDNQDYDNQDNEQDYDGQDNKDKKTKEIKK